MPFQLRALQKQFCNNFPQPGRAACTGLEAIITRKTTVKTHQFDLKLPIFQAKKKTLLSTESAVLPDIHFRLNRHNSRPTISESLPFDRNNNKSQNSSYCRELWTVKPDSQKQPKFCPHQRLHEDLQESQGHRSRRPNTQSQMRSVQKQPSQFNQSNRPHTSLNKRRGSISLPDQAEWFGPNLETSAKGQLKIRLNSQQKGNPRNSHTKNAPSKVSLNIDTEFLALFAN